MTVKYAVVGCLPRSGSAWLTTLLNTQPGVLALHQGIGRFGTEGFFQQAREGDKLVVSVGQDVLVPETLNEFDWESVTPYLLERDTDQLVASVEPYGIGLRVWLDREFEFCQTAQGTALRYSDMIGAVLLILQGTGITPDYQKLRETLNMKITNKRYELPNETTN